MVHAMHRLRAVLKFRGKSRTSHYRDVRSGLYTKPVHIGANSIAWPESEVEALNAARIAGKTDDEIREMVSKLHAQRQMACGVAA